MELATYKTRMLDMLGDPTGSRFVPAVLEQALRQAVNEYSVAVPRFTAATHTVTTAGRTQAITAVTSFENVLSVIFPYNAALDVEVQLQSPYYAVHNGTCLELFIGGETVPQVGDYIYLVYTTGHAVKELDGAAATTVNPTHELLIVEGAAALAAVIRASSVVEVYGKREQDYKNLLKFGQDLHAKYLAELQKLSVSPARARALPAQGWSL